jgi:hypothetical protein
MEHHTNFNDTTGIKGVFHMVMKDRDGNIIDEYEDNNVVLTTGKNYILKALSTKDTNLYTIKNITIGNDVGTGTVMSPTPATDNLTEASQTDVYTTPDLNMTVTYPAARKVTYTAAIDGAVVMASYTTVPNVIYTSATLMTHGGFAIAYKRFTARTISSVISVDISWTLEIL